MRRDLADDWLQRTDFNVKHISYLLGYSDAAAFSRAYKRWTGRSPAGRRDDAGGGGDSENIETSERSDMPGQRL